MKDITGKNEIGDALFMLFAYSSFFGIEITFLKEKFYESVMHNNETFKILSGDNFLFLMIPGLIYLSFKKKDSFLLKFTYLLATLPLLFSSSFFSFNKNIYYLNILLLFIINICLIKYVFLTFQRYKTLALGKKEEQETNNQRGENNG